MGSLATLADVYYDSLCHPVWGEETPRFYEWEAKAHQQGSRVITVPGILWSLEAYHSLSERPPTDAPGLPSCHFARWVVYVRESGKRKCILHVDFGWKEG